MPPTPALPALPPRCARRLEELLALGLRTDEGITQQVRHQQGVCGGSLLTSRR